MLKGLNFLLMMLALTAMLFTGCGDDDGESEFSCNPKCAAYQECVGENTCALKAGMCEEDTDCTTGEKTSCDKAKHECVKPGGEEFDCNTCKEWQECNEAKDACVLKAGRCETKSDCPTDKPLCDGDNTCVAEGSFDCNSCKEWQECNEAKDACVLKAGKCETDDNCSGDTPKCNTTSHECVAEGSFDCNTCKEWQECNAAKDACVLKADRCETDDNCSGDTPKCDTGSHKCVAGGVIEDLLTIAEVKAKDQGTVVKTKGVVTNVYVKDGKLRKIDMQDSDQVNSGITLNYGKEGLLLPEGVNINIHDEIVVSGKLNDSYGTLQLVDMSEAPSVKGDGTLLYPTVGIADLARGYVSMYLVLNDPNLTVKEVADKYVVVEVGGVSVQIKNTISKFVINQIKVGASITKLAGIFRIWKEKDETETFQLYPTSAEDFVVEGGGDDPQEDKCKDVTCNAGEYCNPNTGACEAAESKTIAEIKALTEGIVTLEDVTVTVQELSKKGNCKGYYVQKGNEGLHIRIDSALKPEGLPVVGDAVTIVGKVAHWEGLAQLQISTEKGVITEGSITKTGDANEISPVAGVLPLEESQESVLVTLTGQFTITEMGVAPKWNTKLSYGDGKELIMRSSIYRFNEDPEIKVGTTFTSITGVVNEHTGVYSIVPRKAEDLVE